MPRTVEMILLSDLYPNKTSAYTGIRSNSERAKGEERSKHCAPQGAWHIPASHPQPQSTGGFRFSSRKSTPHGGAQARGSGATCRHQPDLVYLDRTGARG